jgi:hypothetical protein
MAKTYDYALTELSRVKKILGLGNDADPNNDEVIIRKINAATDYIERECKRRFKKTTYTNQPVPVAGYYQERLYLPQRPVTALTSIEYRQGLVGSPTWTAFSTNEYELEGDGKSGIVYFYGYIGGGLPHGNNNIRVTYTAGYDIDWESAGDPTLHNLPADVTEVAENLVVSWYNNQDKHGKESEKFHDGTVVYATDMSEMDKAILSQYRSITQFF